MGMKLAGMIFIAVGFFLVMFPDNWPDYITKLLRYVVSLSFHTKRSSVWYVCTLNSRENLFIFYFQSLVLPIANSLCTSCITLCLLSLSIHLLYSCYNIGLFFILFSTRKQRQRVVYLKQNVLDLSLYIIRIFFIYIYYIFYIL